MTEISISLPLDADGFLRRECPTCERQFKWLPSDPSPNEDSHHTPEAYYCPYCSEPAHLGAWWTTEQVQYQLELVQAQAVVPMLQQFQRDMERSFGRTKGIGFRSEPIAATEPTPLMEPEDMVRVELPCHLEEPLKIDESWEAEVSCLVCGLRYPVQLVREVGGA